MKKLVFALLSLVLAVACSHDEKNDDTQSPQMVLDQPKDGDIFKAGEELHMEMNLTDNENLMQCKVQILPDSIGGGGHKSVLHGGAWEVTRTFQLSGTSFTIDEHIVVPDTIGDDPLSHGRYIFRVHCTDAGGNEAIDEIRFFLEE